jgi:hypothetical protein
MTIIQNHLSQYPYIPCYWFISRSTRHPLFVGGDPKIVVCHCGSSREDLNGYMDNPETDSNDKLGVKCPGGRYRRQVSIHFAWSPSRHEFVQKLPLNRCAWHVGDVHWQGFRVQDLSYGIEGPGPWDRTRGAEEMDAWIRLLTALKLNAPGLEYIVGHQSLDSNKKDPGPGFDWGLVAKALEPIGYTVVTP